MEVKTRPVTLLIGVTRRNCEILYYLCLLRNKQHLLFYEDTLFFPPHKLALRQYELTKEKLAIVLTASNWGLLLSEYDKECYIVTLRNGLRFKVRKNSLADVNAIVETFCKRIYDRFCDNVKEKVVLDIGALIGDTSIMLSIKGAKLVVAYEPDATAFKLALENIRMNNVKT